MTAPLPHNEIDAAPEKGVRNSQPEGIGRVVTLGDLVCWNNLGRNVVFADRRLRPRAIFGTTLYPGDDEPSQFDLDVHAVLDMPEAGCVVVTNHFGTVRQFDRTDLIRSDLARQVEPRRLWSFIADVERTVVAAGRLIGSRPRSEGAAGVLISAPLDTRRVDGDLPVDLFGAGLGEVTGLAVVPMLDPPLLAIGGDGTLLVAPLIDGRLGPVRWATTTDFRVAALDWHDNLLWAAGPNVADSVDDYNWEDLKGGGFAIHDLDGAPVTSGSLPDDVAWGTGGVAVVPFDGYLAAMGRSGSLHLIDPAHPTAHRPTPALASRSLGIAHTTVVGHRVLCGFNRGGYRLHCFGAPGS